MRSIERAIETVITVSRWLMAPRKAAAEASKTAYGKALEERRFGAITTEILDAPSFLFQSIAHSAQITIPGREIQVVHEHNGPSTQWLFRVTNEGPKKARASIHSIHDTASTLEKTAPAAEACGETRAGPCPVMAITGRLRSGRACPLCPGASDLNLFRYRTG